jgi:hypothetical protein
MGPSLNERRHVARFVTPVIDGISVTLRPGNQVELVDLCARGARIHSRRPLRPGARVHLQLISSARTVRLGADVLRCTVALIESNGGVVYCGALKFDHRCELPWEDRTQGGQQLPARSPTHLHDEGYALPASPVVTERHRHRS